MFWASMIPHVQKGLFTREIKNRYLVLYKHFQEKKWKAGWDERKQNMLSFPNMYFN